MCNCCIPFRLVGRIILQFHVFIEEAFDASLRGFLKFVFENLDTCQLLVVGHHLVEVLPVLLHDVSQLVFSQSVAFRFVIVGVYKSVEFLAALDDDAFRDVR